ncbi:MAG: HAD-IA family hydrolase [bacterium]|nr:HAD-IA family hydrolase [bacterium]
MTTLKRQATWIRTISFDCYGTLIDWIGGIRGVFETLAAAGGAIPTDERAFFDAYLEAEAEAEGGPYRPYVQVLAAVQERLAAKLGIAFPPEQANLLAESVPNWKPLPDTNAALVRLKTRYRLGILSNIDNDLFAATARHVDVAFDFVITAQDVGSYKPARGHFDRLTETVATDLQTHLHVAQSLFHDGVPANELGMPFVWINRRNETNDSTARPLAVFDDLNGLADAMGV